jgi:RHS repeat-associated protein
MKSLKRFLVSGMLLLGSSYVGLAQTQGTNYIRTRIPQIPVTDTSKLDTIPIQRQAVNIQYSDGLGRSLQSVQVQGSPGLNDVIIPYAYNNMGRSVKSYLPYADQATAIGVPGSFRSNAATEAVSFYSPTAPGALRIPTDASPFAQTVYEASPLGRVIEQGEVGAVSQPGTGHSVRASYQVNTADDGIIDYIEDDGDILTYPYAPGTLTKTVVTDENGHRLALWKDRQGRTVTRTQLDAPDSYYSTDYFYNDLGQLTYIFTPLAKKDLNFGTDLYMFYYDSLGRVINKKDPEKGWINTVYNHSDQPVLSQDSMMRAKHQWVYMKYDAEGRMVQTGIYTNTTITGRKAMQAYCDNSFPILWETWQPGVGYTNNAFPQQNAMPGTAPLDMYTQFYYDDYSFPEAASKPFQSNSYSTSPTGRTMGMLTGSSVYVLGSSNQRLVTVNYYDKQNRLIQQIGDNHLGRVDVVNNQFNFIGQLTRSERIVRPLPDTVVNIKDRYVYDHLNRLMDTYESFRGAAEVDISHNVYNEIGQKVTEGLHAKGIVPPGTLPATASVITENTTLTQTKYDVATDSVLLKPNFSFTATSSQNYLATVGRLFAQTEEFRYNIKGWLTSINNGTLTYDGGATQSDPNALFGESITYYESSPLAGAVAQYNGNISGMTWRNKIEASGKPGVTTGGQGYTIGYDNVNRHSTNHYFTQTGSTFTKSTTDALTEQVPLYDEMGNIYNLQRSDKNGSIINGLFYTYGTFGNQLTSIYDNIAHPISATFSYDGNGNMITDTYKGITIHYNYLDLPDTISKGSSKLVFTYDAAGNKLYKQLLVGGTVTSQRHYIEDLELVAGNSVATDGKIESIAMDEGRVVNTGTGGYKYEYYLQDHLFNNRVSFRIKPDGSASLSQVQNYYPFGGIMGDSTMNYTSTPLDYYRYSGKELQPELDLNTYDFGARHYSPLLGRWMSVDPLGVSYEDETPYGYVANNPLNMIDPDGMQHLGTIPMTGGTPDYGSTTGFITGTPAGGGSFPWGAVGQGATAASALLQAYDAFKAFSMSAPKIVNFSALNTLQGNPLLLNIPSPQSFEIRMSLRWDPSIVMQRANDAVNESVLAFKHVGSDNRTYQLGAPLFGKAHTDCSSFGCEIAITYGKGYINKSHPFPRGPALNQALWFQKYGYWSTNAKNIRAGDHIFWDRTKPGDNLSYHTAIVSIKNGVMGVAQSSGRPYKGKINFNQLNSDGTQRGWTGKNAQPFVGVGRLKE